MMNVYRVFFGRKLLDYGVIQHQTIDFATWSRADDYVRFCNNHAKMPYISPFGMSPMLFEYAYIEACKIEMSMNSPKTEKYTRGADYDARKPNCNLF